MFFEDRDSFDTPDYAAGFYVISWKDRGRRGDDGNKVNNSYHVKVTLGDPSQNTGEVIASLNVKEGEITRGKERQMLADAPQAFPGIQYGKGGHMALHGM